MNRSSLRRLLPRVAVLVALTAVAFYGGYAGDGALRMSEYPVFGAGTTASPPETFLSVLNTIRADYAPAAASTRADPLHLTYCALSGMLATVNDRYTEFWTPQEYAHNMEETSGVFAGIGATLAVGRDHRIVVVEPIEGSPAARMGVLPGDIVTQINDKPVGADISAATDRIKGDPGTTVRLTLLRKNHPAPIHLLLTRAMVSEPMVEARMEDEKHKIGYLALSMFGENADAQFAGALDKLERRGMHALIFDLRDNPGGLLDAAHDLASRFLDAGTVVWIREKSGKMSPMTVETNKHQGRLYTGACPVVVLVNGYSASAAEIVSGAIKDHQRGTLVGTRTFGKGLVQTIIPLDGGAAVKITTQHYFTPNKTDINKKYDPKTGARIGGGIAPDVSIDLTDADADRIRDARRDNPGDRLAADRRDPQIAKALEILRAQLVP